MASNLVYSGRSLGPKLHSHSGLYYRNPCYAATSLLRIATILTEGTGDPAHSVPPIINHNKASQRGS